MLGSEELERVERQVDDISLGQSGGNVVDLFVVNLMIEGQVE